MKATKPEDMKDFAYGLVRVLGDDNKAHGPWDPKLDPGHFAHDAGHMALVRAFDERMFRGQRQGKTVVLHEVHRRRGDQRSLHRYGAGQRMTWSSPAIASKAF